MPGQQIGCLVQAGFQCAIQRLKIARFHEQANIGATSVMPPCSQGGTLQVQFFHWDTSAG